MVTTYIVIWKCFARMEELELDKKIQCSPPLDDPNTASSGWTHKEPSEATDHKYP